MQQLDIVFVSSPTRLTLHLFGVINRFSTVAKVGTLLNMVLKIIYIYIWV